MNLYRNVPSFFLSLLMLSCGNESLEKSVEGKIILEKVPLAEAPYKIEKVIPLETREDNLLKDYLLVQSNSNGYFIMDKEKEDAIHHFSLDGKYLRKILEVGEGPEMLPSILDFIATEKGLEVLVGKGDKSEIWIYEDSYQKPNKINLEYLAFSFAKSAEGDYLLSGSYNKPIVMHRLVIVNSEGEKINEFLPNDYQNDVLPAAENNFNMAKGRVFFHEMFNNQVFEIKDDLLVSSYQFDFGKYAIPDQYWELDWRQGFELINKNGFAMISHYLETEDKAYFGVNVQADMKMKNHQIILDKSSGKIERRISDNSDYPVFYQMVGLIDGNLVFLTQAKDLIKNEAAFLEQNEVVIEEDDNPVLIFVEF